MNIKKSAYLILTAAAISLSPMIASADPVGLTVNIQCPIAKDNVSMLSNYGDYIAGYGVEKIANQTEVPIYFKSTQQTKSYPEKLESYNNSRIQYNSKTGEVLCSYESNINPAFDISYTLTNARGGFVNYSDDSHVEITIPFGK